MRYGTVVCRKGDYLGGTVNQSLFCSDTCRDRFRADPDRYGASDPAVEAWRRGL